MLTVEIDLSVKITAYQGEPALSDKIIGHAVQERVASMMSELDGRKGEA